MSTSLSNLCGVFESVPVVVVGLLASRRPVCWPVILSFPAPTRVGAQLAPRPTFSLTSFFFLSFPNKTALWSLSSIPASLPRCPSIQQFVQYSSPSQPRQRSAASSVQMLHQVSISAAVWAVEFALRLRFEVRSDLGRAVGAEGRLNAEDTEVVAGARMEVVREAKRAAREASAERAVDLGFAFGKLEGFGSLDGVDGRSKSRSLDCGWDWGESLRSTGAPMEAAE